MFIISCRLRRNRMDGLMQTADPQLLIGDGAAENAVALKDRIFEALSNPRRREALRYLRLNGGDETVLIRTLSERIAAWENGVSPVDVTYKQRKRVYTSLYQSHLPKLHRDGFVEYDADRGTVKLTQKAEQLERVPRSRPPRGAPVERGVSRHVGDRGGVRRGALVRRSSDSNGLARARRQRRGLRRPLRRPHPPNETAVGVNGR